MRWRDKAKLDVIIIRFLCDPTPRWTMMSPTEDKAREALDYIKRRIPYFTRLLKL